MVNPPGAAKSFLEPLAILAFPKPAFSGDQSWHNHLLLPTPGRHGVLLHRGSSECHGSQKGADTHAKSPRKAVLYIHLVISLGYGTQVSLSLQGLVDSHQQVQHHQHLVPGGLVVRIRHSHCRGLGSIPSQGRGSLQPPQVPAFPFPGWPHSARAAPGVWPGVQELPHPARGARPGLDEFCGVAAASCPHSAIRLHPR